MSDERKPLNNKPISANYPPGSTFKLMVALAALEHGANPSMKVHCNGSYLLGKRAFHCWKEGGHGTLDLSGAIKNSCNVYFFTLANSLGIDPIADMAKRFGFGEYFDVSLYGVKSGNVPDDAWKRKNFHGQPWTGGDTLNTAIGQGFVLATPLQLAVMVSRIANGAVPIKPYLVKNKNATNQYSRLREQTLVKKDHLNLVHEGMFRVVNEPGGTAYGKRIDIKGFEMAGKTGTSQVISKRENEMSKEEASDNQNHAIFIGFAPFNDPKYAVSVMVEHGGAGSQAAAPIGREVLLHIQKLDRNMV
jgi:penicillin-binding protein 2